MRTRAKAVLALVAAAVAGLAFATWSAAATTGTTAVVTTTLSKADAAGLTFSREEERMARDLYALFADKYDAAVFSRISASEQRHFDAVGVVLDRYAVPDPAGTAAGRYADATIQQLYDGWRADGLASLPAAYRVGIALETRDIADLQRLQAATTVSDLDRLYAALERGSQHHLAAFTAAADGTTPSGAGYGPGSGMRHGAGAGNGAGAGYGPGSGMRHGAGAGLRDGSCLQS